VKRDAIEAQDATVAEDHARWASIEPIAEERHACVSGVSSQLMHAPGLGAKLEQRRGSAAEDAVVREGFETARAAYPRAVTTGAVLGATKRRVPSAAVG